MTTGGVEHGRSAQQVVQAPDVQRPIGSLPQGESVVPVIGSGSGCVSVEGRVRIATPVLLPRLRADETKRAEPTVHWDKYGKLNGDPLQYFKHSVDEEIPWHGWSQLADDRRQACVVKGIITDDGMVAWSRQRDANHSHLQETITGEEGGTAEFFIVYPRESEEDTTEARIYIYGRPEEDDTALVLRTADYFARNYQDRGSRMQLTLESHGEDGLFQTTTLQEYMDQRGAQQEQNHVDQQGKP